MKNFSEYVKESDDVWEDISKEIQKLADILKSKGYQVKVDTTNSLKLKSKDGFVGNLTIDPSNNKF